VKGKSAPDFVIAGAPKCGTTSLHHWLAQHPAIHMIRGEPHYFAHDLDYHVPPMPARRYRSLCRAAGNDRLCGDRSTWYLYSRTAAAAIRDVNPEAKILILLRQPAELLHSWHAHLCQRGAREPLRSLPEALAAEPERRAGRSLPERGGFQEMYFYSDLSDYVSGIRRFQACFPPEQIRIVLLDDLRDRPRAIYRELLGFLGVDQDFEPDFDVHNRSAPAADTVWRRLWRKGSWRHTVRRWTPAWWQSRQLERKRKRRARAAQRAPWPRLDPDFRMELTRRFEPRIRALEDLLGRDLSAWRDAPKSS
jgi:hypothetical protein